ncbi:hypothetical protein PROFUN_13167, partial [Planoprotostelium fungivorum]
WLQELVVIEDDDSELNHPPSNSPETSRSASSTIKELLQAGEARIQELSDQLKREQDRVDLLKKGATTFGEEFIFGSFFCLEKRSQRQSLRRGDNTHLAQLHEPLLWLT